MLPLARAPLYGRRIVICDYNALLVSVTLTSVLDGMPANVPTLAESFTADQLLMAVEGLLAN